MTRVVAFLRRTRRTPRHRADPPPASWLPVPDTAAMVPRSRTDRTGREAAA